MRLKKRFTALLAALALVSAEILTPGMVLAESSVPEEAVLEESAEALTEEESVEEPAEEVPAEEESVEAEEPAEEVPAEEEPVEAEEESAEAEEEPVEAETVVEESEEAEPVGEAAEEVDLTVLEEAERAETVGSGAEVSNAHGQNYSVYYASTVNANLIKTSGGYVTVDKSEDENRNDRLLVQEYDSNFNWVSRRYIAQELPIYGGFYNAGNAYYYLSGQYNFNEDDSVEVFRITKYDTSWNRIGSASIKGANTYIPFDAGSARFALYGNYLFIRTCHEMYKYSDGKHHQANVTIKLNTSSMKVESCAAEIKYAASAFISHSFNQFIVVDDQGYVVALDHGDANPRAACLIRCDTKADSLNVESQDSYTEADLMSYYGTYGDNTTYASLGGLSFSGSNYLTVGNSNKQDGNNDSVRNVYVTVNPRSGFPGTTTLKWLTSHEAGGTVSTSTPQLVKISSNKFLVLWEEGTNIGTRSEQWTGCRYAFIDGSANVLSSGSFDGALSDCVPIVDGNKICWYVTDEDETSFYVLGMDGSCSVVDHTIRIESAENETTGIRLAWEDTGSTGYYNVYQRDNDYSSYDREADWTLLGTVKGSSYLDETAVGGHGYYYTVRPAASDGTVVSCSWDAAGKFVVRVPAPELNGVEATGSGIYLTWTTTGDGSNYTNYMSNHYVIWRKTQGSDWEAVGKAEGDDDTYYIVWDYTDETAASGTLYTYTVSASITRIGETFEGPKNENGLTTMYLKQPRDVSLTAVQTGVQVSWNAIPGAKSYKVYRMEREDLEYIKKYEDMGYTVTMSWPVAGTTSKTSLIDTGARCGEWFYIVQAFSGSYESAREFALDGPHIIYVQTTVITDAYYNSANNAVYLDWNYVNYASGYRIYRRVSDGEWSKIGETTSSTTSFDDTNPPLGKIAEYAVTALYKDSDGTTHEGLKNDPAATVDLNKIRLYKVSAEKSTYTGKAITPTFKVVNSSDGSELSSSYYTAKYSNNVKAGTGKITVTGKGEYTGTITGTFVIEAKTLTSSMVGAISAQTYTGAALQPAVTVTDGSTVLTAGTDYTAVYSNNTNAGTATVKITGKGNYKGTVSATFVINQAAPVLSFAKSSLTKTNLDAAFTNKLTATTDGTITYKSSSTSVAAVNKTSGKVTIKGIGTATITATATAGTNYKAGSAKYTLTVKDGRTDVAGLTITLSKTKYTYDGKVKKPAVTVKNGDVVLTAGTDYTVSYGENIYPPTGSVTITGMGSYKGSVEKTFTIDGGPIKSISLSETSITMVYGDEKAVPAVTYTPDFTSDTKTVTWSSSDTDFVTAADGKIKAVNPGKAVITAKVPGRNVSAAADVRVLFKDVTDKSSWYYEPVYWALDNDVTSGYGPGTFQPMAGLSRAQTVTFLYRLAGSPDVSKLTAQEFTDVTADDWFYAAVKWAAANGITAGYGPGTFQPYKTCTRAMIVTFLSNYAKLTGTYKVPAGSSNFTDVPQDAWYKDSVDWAVANGITKGYGSGTFQPDVTCTRAMMVTFLKKTAELPKA